MATINAGTQKYREEYSARKKADILSSAMSTFKSKGFPGTTMNMICERADVSIATVYKNFASKEALFATCIEAHFGALDDGSIDTQPAEVFLEEVQRAATRLIILPSGYPKATEFLSRFISKTKSVE